jgi:putative transposase
MDRTTKLHQREFDVLPEAWGRLNDAFVKTCDLPFRFERSLVCTNSIENMMGTVCRVCRNVKRWRNVVMALRWTAAGMPEAAKGFRRLKARKQLPALRTALAAHHAKHVVTQPVAASADAA